MGANVETARVMYDSFAAGDVASVLAAFDDKIDWQEPDGLPFENQVGPQAVAENVFGSVLGQIRDFRLDVREFVDGDDIVCTIGTYHGTGATTGVELDADFVHVLRFGGDGKINGFRTYTDTHLWRQSLGL
jgi:ketosteroid isomerase-like protein